MGKRPATKVPPKGGGKAANGTGSVVKRTRSGRVRFYGELMIGRRPDGRKNVLSSPGFDTEPEADLWLSQQKVARATGTMIEPSKRTVGEYLIYWLTQVAADNVKPTTFSTYEWIVRHQLVPELGHHQLNKLQPVHVQNLYHEAKQVKQLAGNTVRNLHRVLHRALEHAKRQGMVSVNVTDHVERPKVKRTKMRSLTFEEGLRLLKCAEADRLQALWVIALTMALRQGELLGLRWSDIDFEAGTLRIEQTISDVNGKLIYNTPKSESSRRTLSMPPMVASALRQWRGVQLAEKMARRDVWEENDLVFTSQRGTPIGPNNLRRRQYPALMERAGLVEVRTVKRGRSETTRERPKIRFHDLRHTSVTMMREIMEPEEVQGFIGHADITTTLRIYSHLWEKRKKAAGQKIQDLWSSGDRKAR